MYKICFCSEVILVIRFKCVIHQTLFKLEFKSSNIYIYKANNFELKIVQIYNKNVKIHACKNNNLELR